MALYKLKKGYGPHRRREGRSYKDYFAGDEIELSPMEVATFGDKFELIGPPEPGPEDQTPSVGFKLQHRGGGKYNVINERSGKPINDVLLSKEEAESLIGEALTHESEEEKTIEDSKEESEIEQDNGESEAQVEGSEDLADEDRVPIRRRSNSK